MFWFFRFFRRYGFFLFFLFLELVGLRLYLQGSSRGALALWSTLRQVGMSLHAYRFAVHQYFSLHEQNTVLARENEMLRQSLARERFYRSLLQPSQTPPTQDTLAAQVGLLGVRVIGNSYHRMHNILTLGAGQQQGLQPGMGLLGPDGIAGVVKHVSAHFAVAYSLLDIDLLTSARLGKQGPLCSVRWAGQDPYTAQVDYLPRHLEPKVGDTVYTSGFDNSYAPALPIGQLLEVGLRDESSFYDAKLRFFTDFYSLHQVYGLVLSRREERDSLEMLITTPSSLAQ